MQDVAGREITPNLRDDTARRIADIRASDEGRAGVASFLNKTRRLALNAIPMTSNADLAARSRAAIGTLHADGAA